MKVLGLLLVTVGLLALVYGGIRYTHQNTVLEVESMRSTALDPTTLPFQPIVAGIAIVGGLLILLLPERRTA